MLLAITIVFLFAIVTGLFYERNTRLIQFVLATLLLSLLVYFGTFYSQIILGDSVVETNAWVASLHIGLDMYLDGLSYFFVLLILGIGLLVLLYSFQYMQHYQEKGRFFAYLLFFLGSMMGLVLSANPISLFVFWELTSLSSFLLIGFQNEKKESRRAARMALLITAGGGLALLAGLILLSILGGNSYDIPDLLTSKSFDTGSSLVTVTIMLIIIGAATKSAQFPFHFWLPGAMAAPTPVSTYLHSATMVKAGVYLILRVNPIVESIDLWGDSLGIVGAVTMTYGAFRSLQEDDLKKILAYTTISALGIFFMMVGVGGSAAVNSVVIYILAHALYKGTLFLTAGAIDHEAGTRKLSELSNLKIRMPITSIVMSLALASMAGLIPFIGFVGKEALYDVLYHASGTVEYVFLILLFVAGAFFTAVAIDVVKNAIFSKVQGDSSGFGEAGLLMLLPSSLLAASGLLFGIFPGILLEPLLKWTSAAALAGQTSLHLKLWHGFNVVFLLSLLTLLSGVVLYKFRRLFRVHSRPAWLQSDFYYDRLLLIIDYSAKVSTRIIQNGLLRNYIAVTVLVFCSVQFLVLLDSELFNWPTQNILFRELQIYEVVILVLVVIATGYLFKTRSKLIVTATFGIIGYSIALAYVLFSAPDVAITQFLAETLTLILLILILHRLPSYTLKERIPNRWYLPVAILFGLTMTFVSYTLLNSPKGSHLKSSVLTQSISQGKGQNAVNVILVDFRALDTFGEITVLTVTMLGIIALLRFKKESADL